MRGFNASDPAAAIDAARSFRYAEIVVNHDTFVTVASCNQITGVTEYGSLIASYAVGIKGGPRYVGYAEVFSDCPEEV